MTPPTGPGPAALVAPLRCVADDYGQHAGIDDAVRRLAAAGRLHGTSCLVNGPRWREAAAALADLPSGFATGLHLNLTDGEPLSPDLRRLWPELPRLPRLLATALARRLPTAAVAAEWRAQLDAFVDACGRLPDHVDGHQHVHHLPGVREAVLATLDALPTPPTVRSTGHLAGPGGHLKQRVIEATGGRALDDALRARRWPRNPVLLGAYGLRPDADYPALMRAWLALAVARAPAADPADPKAPLLFCHPATSAPPDDPIGPARLREFAWLAGDGFAADLAAAADAAARRSRPHAGTR